jgi:NADPH-dependent ferric siderophore reductase
MSDRRELPMRIFRAQVISAVDVSPSLRRIVFGGPGLSDFASTGVGDEYLRIIFPPPGETEPVFPTITDDVLDYSSIDLGLLRTYTVRHFEPGQVTVEFVVHDGGVAATWARAAKPGDVVGLNTPTGMYDPPAGLDWQILVADCAALPAAARLLAQTPPDVRTRVVVEVPDADHHVELPAHPRAEVTWIYGGNGHGRSRLEEIVRSLPKPDGTGYVWVSGESKALRGVRRYLRKELELPAASFKVVGYWIEGAEDWHAKYDALDESSRASLEALWASGRSEDEIEDEYDEKLTALGL